MPASGKSRARIRKGVASVTSTTRSERAALKRSEREAKRRMGLVIDLLASYDPSLPEDHSRRDQMIGIVRGLMMADPKWFDTLTDHFVIPDNPPPDLDPGLSTDEWLAHVVEWARAVLAYRSEPLRQAFEEFGNVMALVEMAGRGWHHQPWVQSGLQALELIELGPDRKAQAVSRYFLDSFYRVFTESSG